MQARTESHAKQCVEAHQQPHPAAHLTRQEVRREEPCGLQVVLQREVSSDALQNSPEQHTPDAKSRGYVEEFRAMFFVASVFGVHVIKRLGDGCYSFSLPRMCAAFVVLCLTTACLAVTAVAFYLTDASRDLRLFVTFLLLSGIMSAFTFIVWMTKSSRIMAFLTEVDANPVAVKKPKWLLLVMVTSCLLPLVYTVTFLFMTPLSDYFLNVYPATLLFLIPVYLSAVLLFLVDIYIMVSVHVVVAALRSLEGRVRDARLWTPQLTNEVADHWLRLTKLVATFNEAFSFVLHLRMLIFLVEMISLLFSLVSLRWEGRCLLYFWILAGKNLGVVLHFLAMCVSGERVLTAQEAVEGAMREVHARYDSAQPPKDCQTKVAEKAATHWQDGRLTRLCVHNLLCRIEARPLSVHIWGDSSLGGQTFVTCMGLVATYLVVLLQLRQPSSNFDEDANCFEAMK